jgi:hypothetical protein
VAIILVGWVYEIVENGPIIPPVISAGKTIVPPGYAQAEAEKDS